MVTFTREVPVRVLTSAHWAQSWSDAQWAPMFGVHVPAAEVSTGEAEAEEAIAVAGATAAPASAESTLGGSWEMRGAGSVAQAARSDAVRRTAAKGDREGFIVCSTQGWGLPGAREEYGRHGGATKAVPHSSQGWGTGGTTVEVVAGEPAGQAPQFKCPLQF